ncbi:nuclear transport factor 2 family protein [Sinorhizobium fredii]|uniref:nuclear transport factor 2 family protein n=1 Tax=Rhizobium fredii TaxID=380 RepID=UPI00339A2691
MTDRNELESAVKMIYGARNENDLDAIMGWFDPSCRFRIVGSTWLGPMTEPVNGTDSIRSSIQALLDNWDLSGVSIVSLHVDGDTVCVHRAGPVAVHSVQHCEGYGTHGQVHLQGRPGD